MTINLRYDSCFGLVLSLFWAIAETAYFVKLVVEFAKYF